MEINQLNKTELELMKYLWELEKGFMKDIVEQYPEPRPAYTTISTLISRMCEKEYIGFTRLGRDKQYFPMLKKSDYFSNQMKGMIKYFFNNSASQFASFFTKNTDLDLDELERLEALVRKEINQKKENE